MVRLTGVALIALLGACASNPVEAPVVPMDAPIVGGYAPANLESDAVKAAQAVALNEIYKNDKTSATIMKVEAQQQVVAGMNYKFDITLNDNSRFQVTVYRDLQGEMSVTGFVKLS